MVLVTRLIENSLVSPSPQLSQRLVHEVTAFAFGVALLSVLAQVGIPLPFTPVPITGQTFGVTLIALLWGARRAPAIVLSYLGLGVMGLPVMAVGASAMKWGPTSGYLIGMVVSSWIIGKLSEHGATSRLWTSCLAGFAGSFFVFLFGAAVLSVFLPDKSVFLLGIAPFLPGDLIKNISAGLIAWKLGQRAPQERA